MKYAVLLKIPTSDPAYAMYSKFVDEVKDDLMLVTCDGLESDIHYLHLRISTEKEGGYEIWVPHQKVIFVVEGLEKSEGTIDGFAPPKKKVQQESKKNAD